MITENIQQTNVNGNSNQRDFVDKLISIKGLVKITLFFTIQVAVLLFQLQAVLSPYSYSINYDYWTVNGYVWNNIFLNYFFFALILLFIFAFYLGKELKMKDKEKFVFFSFKFFVFGTIFLILNAIILFNAISFQNLGQSITYTYGSLQDFFISSSAYYLAFIWFVIIITFLTIKFVSFWVHLFSRKDKKQKKNQPNFVSKPQPVSFKEPNLAETFVNQSEQNPVSQFTPSGNVNQNLKPSATNLNISKSPNKDDYLTKEQIRLIQMTKQEEYKNSNQKSNMKIEPNTVTRSEPEKEVRPSTPMPIIRFLDKRLFKHSLFEQAIIFYVLTEFIFLFFFSVDLYQSTNGFAYIHEYPSPFLSTLSNYALMEFLF